MRMSYLQQALLSETGFTAESGDAIRETNDPIWSIGIDVTTSPRDSSSSGTWWSQIQCHGSSEAEAKAMRDFILQAVHEKIARMTMEDFKALS